MTTRQRRWSNCWAKVVEALESRTFLSVYYVDANAQGTATGLTWGNAFPTLEQATAVAVSGDQIDVAGGTYKPTTTTDNTASFNLSSGVGIFGGYAGSASASPNTRNISQYPTILSGDIGQAGYSGDNSQVIVTASNGSASTTLDGVTLTASQGSAALQILSGSPTISNCTFKTNNGTYFGGGIHNNSGTPTILDCTFIANSAVNGAGIYNDHGTLTAINDVFVGNTGVGTYYAAAGIYTTGGKSVITNCTFTANTGAAVAQDSSQILLSNSICWGDATRPQDEVYDDSTPPTTAAYDDIAGAFAGTANLNTDPMFVRNPSPGPDGVWGTADDDLGNLSLRPFSPAIDAGYSAELPASVVTDIAGNNRFQRGPAAGQTGVGSGVVDLGAYEASAVLAARAGGPYYIAAGQAIKLTGLGTSATAGGLSYSWDLNGDNVFGDATGATPTFSTSGLSIGSVVSIYLKVTDSSSASVVSGTTVTVVTPTLYVDSHAAGANNGLDWADALTTLNAALNTAVNSQVIDVAGGTYTPTPDGNTKASFQLKNGVKVYGGYAGSANPSNPNLRSASTYPTILSGAIANQNTSQAVVTGTGTDSSAVLDSVTISGGSLALNNDPGSPTVNNCLFVQNSEPVANYLSSPLFSGCTFNASGAVQNNAGSPTFSNCSFLNNQAYASGGAMNNFTNSAPLITGCTFTGNSSYSGGGGAIYNYIASPTIVNCVFTNNVGESDGGAIYTINGSIKITGCSFIRNRASAFSGGALFLDNCPVTITSCIFDGNSAADGGAIDNEGALLVTVNNSLFVGDVAGDGGVVENASSALLNMSNCTLVANQASQSGGAIYDNNNLPQLTNCILWSNNASSGTQFYYNSIHASYCDIGQTYTYNSGNVANQNTDPKFVRNPSPGADGKWGTADDDYGDEHLQISSPLVNAGSNAGVPAGLTTDLGGSARISGGTVDIGAYETVYTATFTGSVFIDTNGDGNLADATPAGAGLTIYIDANNNGVFDAGETSYQTNSAGQVTFSGLLPGTYNLRQSLNASQWLQTVPAANAAVTITVTPGQSVPFSMADFQTQSVSGVYSKSSIEGTGSVPSGTALQVVLSPPNSGTPITYTATTDANGNYSISALGPGSITVTPGTLNGNYSVSPSSLTTPSVSGSASIDSFVATAQGSITGKIFADTNDNGTPDAGESALSGVQVFLDVLNGPGGTITAAIPAMTDTNGVYLFSNVPAGNFLVQENLPPAYAGYSVPSAGSYNLASFAGTASTGNNFGDLTAIPSKQLTGTVIGTSGSYQNDGNTIAKAVDGNLATFFDAPTSSGAWVGLDLGSPMIVTSLAYASRSGWASRMNGGIFQASNSSTFASGVVNLYTIASNANPPSSSLTTQSISNSTAFRYVRYVGPANGYCNVAEVQFSGTAPAGAAPSWLLPGTGAVYTFNGSSLTVSSGTISIVGDPLASGENVSISLSGNAVVQFQTTATLASISLNNTSTAALTGSGITLTVSSLSLSATASLDLKANSMVVNYIPGGPSPISTLAGYLRTGFITGDTAGLFTSSNGTNPVVSLGIVDNAVLTAQGAGFKIFGGVPVGNSSVLIKYTYFGDANLSGNVDSADYARIDNGYLAHGALTGWYNGDFNDDGVINGSDYTLIDNAFNRQGASLAAQIAGKNHWALRRQSAVSAALVTPQSQATSRSPQYLLLDENHSGDTIADILTAGDLERDTSGAFHLG